MIQNGDARADETRAGNAEKEERMTTKQITEVDLDKARQNFSEVKKQLQSGECRNIAFKKPMSFYREHSVEKAISLIKKEATVKRAAEIKVGQTIRAANGVEGIIKDIKKESISRAIGPNREGKSYVVIEWKNPKKKQQKITAPTLQYLVGLERDKSIEILSKSITNKSTVKARTSSKPQTPSTVRKSRATKSTVKKPTAKRTSAKESAKK